MVCEHFTQANLAHDLHGKLIYKDECTKCYTSCRDQNGIDVCLKCFNGACLKQNNHSQHHYAATKHPIALNIKEIVHVKEKTEAPKINKVAIGVAGGIDFSDDEIERILTLKCIPCGIELDRTNPLAAPLVDSVILANSAYIQTSVQEWELEIKPCPHTLELKQEGGHIASKSLAHCGDCELKANLWLCLACGHLGCGRKNYDGTGGNNHGMEHYKSSNHPVVCKLGTITPEGSASLHCYACDDEVKDPKLSDHLHTFGIDIKSQVKTEKTISEMELDSNLALTLSKIVEEGRTLVPLFGSGYTGLQNLGNSCYMASVIQVLFSFDEFQKTYFTKASQHLHECNKSNPAECFHCQISKLAHGLLSGDHSVKREVKKVHYEGITEEEKNRVDYDQEGVKPMMFKSLIGKGHPEFQTNRQQDALEYFGHLLEKIERAEKAIGSNYHPGKIFDFNLETRIKCQECGGVRYSKQKAFQLTVTIPAPPNADKDTKVPFDGCLEKLLSSEIVEYNCTKCGHSTNFEKTTRFASYPKVLVISPQRFVFNDWVPKKLEVDLQVPLDNLDLEVARGHGIQPGETELPGGQSEFEEVEPEINQAFLQEVIGFGIPELYAKHALINTGNQSTELAAGWYFENIGNPALDQPIAKVKTQKAGQKQETPVSEELLVLLISMGFSESASRKALIKCDNNVERATDYLFSHTGEEEEDVPEEVKGGAEEEKNEDQGPAQYKLHAFVTHLGPSVHCGHYVAHILKDDKWVLYNDDKVASSSDPPFGKAYLYFYVRK